MVDGNAGDKVQLTDGRWARQAASFTSGGNSYTVFYNVAKATTLYVKQGVAVDYTGIEAREAVGGYSGFVLNGECASDNAGYSVSSAGDFNGDGLTDLLVSAPYNDGAGGDAGRVYVVYGRTSTAPINLSAIAAGNGGFALSGEGSANRLGIVVSAAGDVNGDGLADIVMGAYTYGPNTGRGYVIFGRTGGVAPTLSGIEAGTAGGFVINSQGGSNNYFGRAVAGAGDVNGDGLADVIIGAMGFNNNTGQAYVIYGKTDGVVVSSAAIAGGSGGFVVLAECSNSYLGISVDGAGDVNGDGLTDIIVGASNYSGGTGRTYVVFGRTGGGNVATSALGTGGFTITGETTSGSTGYDISYLGDVNGDGLADMLLGAYAYGSNAGRAYVIFGRTSGNLDINVASSSLGTRGFAIVAECAGDLMGETVSEVGDFNGDGLADMLVGARGNDAGGDYAGRAYVIYGRAAAADIQLSDIARGIGGFTITGECISDQLGLDASAAGDINGDGLADILVGARNNSASATNAGRAYVIFGRTDGTSSSVVVDVLGTASAEALSDGGTGKYVLAGAGDDTLTLTAASVMDGQAGNDTFVVDGAAITLLQSAYAGSGKLATLKGGLGVDTLKLSGAGLTLDLTQVSNVAAMNPSGTSRLSGIEKIDITGSGDNVLKLTAADIADMSGINVFETTGRYQLMVDGNAGDKVQLTDGRWARQAANFTSGSNSYTVFYNVARATTLYVKQGVAVEYAGIEATEIANGYGGFVLNGECTTDFAGASVSSVGDFNGDGLGDLIVGAPNNDATGSDAGRAYLIYGRTGTGAINLSSVAAGSGGFALAGEAAGNNLGGTVSAAGDVNGDGLADIVLGTSGYNTNTGRVYVIFGRTGGAAPVLSAIAAGSGGFVVNGEGTATYFGGSVAGAGDVNGDGLADIVVGATGYNNSAGRSYVIFGKTSGTAVAASAVAAGSGGFALHGEASSVSLGVSVSGAGDINGDGLADIVVGSHGYGGSAGRSYVVFGKTGGGVVSGSGLGTGGFTITGETTNSYMGFDVAYAGDVNGDGLADIIVGAYGYTSGTGRAYVIFGRTSGNLDINVASTSLGTRGFAIVAECASDLAGYNLEYAGDVNGDGLADVLVSARFNGTAGTNAGRSYLLYGRAGTSAVQLSDVSRGIGGFAITGECASDEFGVGVSAAGDINGDGLADIVVGARQNDAAASNAGRAYVIFGRTDGTSSSVVVDVMGTASADTLSDGGTGKYVLAG
ncbi:integrin alpha, partial [Aureimonas altamirensis]